MTYMVFYRINGRCRVAVDADSLAEAVQIADTSVGEMDFGELEDIEWDGFCAEEIF